MQTRQAYQQQHCNVLKISFTQSGQQLNRLASSMKGRTWGFRLHLTVSRGLLFQVRLQINPITTTASLEPVSLVERPSKIENKQTSGPSNFPNAPTPTSRLSKRPRSTLFNVILGEYSILNAMQSELTESCWLCLSRAPPYYEGIAIDRNYTVSNGSQYSRKNTHQEVQEVTGWRLVCWHCPVRQAVFKCLYPDYSIHWSWQIPLTNSWHLVDLSFKSYPMHFSFFF